MAQVNLGLLYEYGNGVNRNIKSAIKWYELSARGGKADGQRKLGEKYLLGTGVDKDVQEAARLFRLSAKQGHKEAQEELAQMYEKGVGLIKDNSAAYMWFSIAAANGNEEAATARDRLGEDMQAEKVEIALGTARVCMESDYEDCGFSTE